MKFLTFSLLFFASLAQAEVGFHFFDEGNLPPALSTATDSVYQLVVPAGKTVTVSISNSDESVFKETAKNISAGRWRPDIREAAIVAQLRICQKRQQKICSFFIDLQLSTAFLLKNPRSIIATYHGIEEFMKGAKLMETELIELALPFTLIDKDSKVVRSADIGLKVAQLLPRKGGEGMDLSIFIADNFDPEGLTFNPAATILESEDLFAVGYPGVTTTRTAQGKQDAKEDVLTWTVGKLTSASALARTELMNYMYSYDISKTLANTLLITDHDGNGGLSGGPLLNRKGEVVGVITNGVFPKKENPPLAVVSANLLQVLK